MTIVDTNLLWYLLVTDTISFYLIELGVKVTFG